jgi:hypothetical protein
MTYQIESRIPDSTDVEARQWSAYAVGMPGNNFATREEAEAAIEDLRKLGEEWASAEYRVTERDVATPDGWADPCPDCGERSLHRDGCSEIG